ncbi:uncharacterized protein [Leptinotarsa decemlineata]|uniref:uncharacterized protein n=1 Tax=Leptinotarsa decemlineata TaxID=7539 RepID=UPI003D305001
MADIRLWSKDLTSEFLDIYKANSSFWKVKSDEYKNKNLKDISYNKLIKFCHNNGMPHANRDFVVKKIQSLKGSFRKELKKVMNSHRSGSGTDDIYKPNLWYYDLLLFTKDQETPTDGYHNEDEQTEDSIEEEGPSTSTTDQQNTSTVVEEQEKQVEQNTPTVVEEARVEIQKKETGPTPRKRKAAPLASSHAEFLKVCADTMKIAGINVAKKLAKMDLIQAIYAESLINNVLRKGLLQKLTEETNLCDGCDRRATPSSVHSYMSNYYNTNMPNTYQSFS